MITIHHPPSTIKATASFTLIELLTVIVIIMVLAGLAAGIARYALIQAHVNRAKAEIATLEMVLGNFQIDNGRVPTATAPLTGSSALYTALASGTRKYMTFKKDQTNNVSGQVVIIDPFGQPYRYWFARPPDSPVNTNNPMGFDLWSAGADGTDYTTDDINNWSK
jgi:type II secretory pathway pseudopilin PulG